MATSIHTASTSTGLGSWVQMDATNAYVKIVASGSARVQVVSSDTNGPGAGGEVVVEADVYGTDTVVLPSGTYWVNADIKRVGDGDVDVVVQN